MSFYPRHDTDMLISPCVPPRSPNSILQSLREWVPSRLPVVLAQDADSNLLLWVVFIAEITARAFIIADSNKRRTLSRSDIAKALSKSDQFDFLIDIVPRDEMPFPGVVASANGPGGKKAAPAPVATKRDPVRIGLYRWVSFLPSTFVRLGLLTWCAVFLYLELDAGDE